MGKGTILSIDDDQGLQIVVGQYLEDNGYDVIQAYDVASALQCVAEKNPDVILLDLTLPDGEGLSLIPQFKATSDAGILVVSGKNDTTEKIVCLEMGADDYITKPFEMRELSARIKAVLRRMEGRETQKENSKEMPERIELKTGWYLDRSKYQAFDNMGDTINLTTGEFKLLEALATAPERVLSREHLFEITRGIDYDSFDRAIDIQIARLRKKLNDSTTNDQMIKTVRGVGYMFCRAKKQA